jgi:transposase
MYECKTRPLKRVHLIYGVVKSGKPFDAKIPLKGLAIQDGI